MKVTVDPKNDVPELCEVNNERCELNYARATKWGYNLERLNKTYDSKSINMVGSFSYYDWFNAQSERLSVMMREAVYPTTSPVGIKDAIRTDNFFELKTDNSDNEPYGKEGYYYDGGFPIVDREAMKPDELLMIVPALLHEFGHTCIALADLYGFPVKRNNVFCRDKNGKLYSEGALIPEIDNGFTNFTTAQNVECGIAYEPLMAPATCGCILRMPGRCSTLLDIETTGSGECREG